jgi:hypothetical protein
VSEAPLGRTWLVTLAVLFEGGLALVAWGAAWLFGEPLWARLDWSAEAAAWGVAATLPMLAVFGLCLQLRLPPLARIRRLCEEVIRPLFAPCGLAELALISLLAGLGEEALFRGVLQTVLARWLATWAAVVLTAVVFGLLHALTPTYALLATLMGAYLGVVWLVAGNLLVVILAHALYDFVVLVYLTRSPPLPSDI